MLEIYDSGEIDVKYPETESMTTGILTKVLNAYKYKYFCEIIGLSAKMLKYSALFYIIFNVSL